MNAKGQGDPGEDHASRVGAESPCSDMKRAVAKKLIERYFYQLTDGCGNPDCDNQNCASSGKVTNLTPNQAAAQAIQLFSQEARLCDGTQPSKVARTTLEPGPASLAKSLPGKSVNPTCSDEGIATNSGTHHAPLVGDSIMLPAAVNMDSQNYSNIRNEPDFICPLSNVTNDSRISKYNLTNIANTSNNPVLHKEPSVSACLSKTQINNNNNLCQARHSCIASIADKSIFSDEENFLNIFQRHKIYITEHHHKPIRKRIGRHKNLNKTSKRSMTKKRFQKKRISAKNCSKSLTKLLILALYLRDIRIKRYTNYARQK